MKLIKISLVSLLTVFAVLFAITACKEQNDRIVPLESGLKSSANPYDYVGVFHNDALLDFANDPSFPNLSPLTCINKAQNLYIQKGLPYTTLPTTSQKQAYAAQISSLPSDGTAFSSTIVSLYSGGKINLNVRNALLQINDAMKDTLAYNQRDVAKAFDYLISNVNKLEVQFLQTSYTQAEREIILPVVSIAKYSLIFWKDSELNSSNPYYEGEKRSWFGRFWRSIAVSLADAAGGALGAAIGGPTTVGSAIGAGIVGGAASFLMKEIVK